MNCKNIGQYKDSDKHYNMSPVFTVIIPVYNKEEYITRSIHSVLNQTFLDFELIVVCEPSTDQSSQYVQKITDPRVIILYRPQKGPGGYAARNLGISYARGRWITFLDADDELYSDYLQNIFALSNRYPHINVITCARLNEHSGKASLDKFSSHFSCDEKIFSFLEYLKYSVKFEHPFHTNTVAFTNTLLSDNYLFPEGQVERSGDLYAWVMLAAKAQYFVWSSCIGSKYYTDVSGVSKNNLPSIEINYIMVEKLQHHCTKQERYWLTRYANHLIRRAWFERKIQGLDQKHLFSYLYWRNHYIFCLYWGILGFLPSHCLSYLKKLKAIFN